MLVDPRPWRPARPRPPTPVRQPRRGWDTPLDEPAAVEVAASRPPPSPHASYDGLRRHPATLAELDACGVGSVEELVGRVNAALAERGRPPLSQGDFPTTRRGFARLARLLSSLGEPGAPGCAARCA